MVFNLIWGCIENYDPGMGYNRMNICPNNIYIYISKNHVNIIFNKINTIVLIFNQAKKKSNRVNIICMSILYIYIY